MRKTNKIIRLALSDGLLGSLTTNPRRALERAIEQANAEGRNCRQILPHQTRNAFIVGLQGLLRFCTLGLWTFEAGYQILLEKPDAAEPRKGRHFPLLRRG